jgi:hypothetical protein
MDAVYRHTESAQTADDAEATVVHDIVIELQHHGWGRDVRAGDRITSRHLCLVSRPLMHRPVRAAN